MASGPQTSRMSPSERQGSAFSQHLQPSGGQGQVCLSLPYPELSSQKPYLHASVFHTGSHTPPGVEKHGGVRENSEGW